MNKKKHIALIMTQSPYGKSLAKEAIDVALTAAAFEQKISVIFINEGVFQLLAQKPQDASHIEQKTQAKLLSVLPMYDVEDIYIDQQSINERGLSASDFMQQARIVETNDINKIIHLADTVLSF